MFCLSFVIVILTLMLSRSFLVVYSAYIALATERQHKIRINRRLLATYAREVCCHSLFSVLNLVGKLVDPSRLDSSAEESARPTIVLISDLGWRSATLIFLRIYLQQRGWTRVVCVGLENPEHSLSDHAVQLAKTIETLEGTNGQHAVDLIGHGAGGLVAAWYCQHLDAPEKHRRLITLGTAWKGSRTAVLSTHVLVEKLIYKAPILDDLHPATAQVSCIWSPDDPTIVPPGSAAPAFNANCLEIEAAGHLELLISARAFRGIRTCLEAVIVPREEHAQ